MVSLQSIIWVFLLNNFSRVINLLLTKVAQDHPGRISALGLFCTDRAQQGPYCQDLGSIFSQYGPRAWLMRYNIRFNLIPANYNNVLQLLYVELSWAALSGTTPVHCTVLHCTTSN